MESQPSYPPPAAPAQPEKKSKVWLWVVIGLVVACLGCVALVGILSLIGINVFNNQVSESVVTEFEELVTEQPVLQDSSLPFITDVVMTNATTGENLDPVGETDQFAPADTVHAVVVIEDAPEGTTFGAVWYAEDVGSAAEPNTLINQTELTASGSRNLDFTLEPESTWPAGSYRVEITVNGDKVTTVPFYVVE